MDSRPDKSSADPVRETKLPEPCIFIARKFFAEVVSERWQLSFKVFQAALARSAAKRFDSATFSAEQFEDYVSSLHLRDLGLACACSQGSEAAWEDFVTGYRSFLRAASAAILHCTPFDPSAIELADSLFSDLYGLSGQTAGSSSLFRYFHGRSSLKTWLRAVLVQRRVDQVRVLRKFDSLDEQPSDGESRRIREPAIVEVPADPRREQYLERFREALTTALASLDARDRSRLQLYYAEGRTLAEIGRAIGEHESSVSRNLERIRKELRATVEGLLRAGSAASNGKAPAAGLDGAQTALCIQYAAEDAAIDLDKLFDVANPQNPSGPDRPDIDRRIKP
jgi:RNA polymerase sigma-70 factor (ECF subfamily)